MPGLTVHHREMVKTPYGAPSCPLIHGELNGVEVIFLARHGRRHTIPPHLVNYQANIQALREVGATHTIALAAVGGIADDCVDQAIVIPDQIIDYTYGRSHTFHAGTRDKFEHIDFTEPYAASVRDRLLLALKTIGVPHVPSGVYGATQGPRLETAAEICRLERDGCTIVGMTGMPEASLARELGIDYACCAMVVNRAAGKSTTGISFADIETNVRESVENVQRVLVEVVSSGFT